MNGFRERLRAFFECEDGPTATEYAVLLSLILTGAIAVLTTLGGQLNDLYLAIFGAVT